jgi:hypothetical protein
MMTMIWENDRTAKLGLISFIYLCRSAKYIKYFKHFFFAGFVSRKYEYFAIIEITRYIYSIHIFLRHILPLAIDMLHKILYITR